MSKNTFENSKLQLEVTNYCITEDGTTLIELSVRNHAQITRIENEDHCSHATEFDRQTCLLDTLLFSIYSKVRAQNQKKNSFFLPIDFSCSEDSFRQIREFVETAGFKDSIKFILSDKENLENNSFIYSLEDEGNLFREGFLEPSNATLELEGRFDVKTVTFSTPIPEEEKPLKGFDTGDFLFVPDTHEATIPYVVLY